MRIKRAFTDPDIVKWLETIDEQTLGKIIEEIADEALWQEKFARDTGKLDALAVGFREEIARGETTPFDPDTLPTS